MIMSLVETGHAEYVFVGGDGILAHKADNEILKQIGYFFF